MTESDDVERAFGGTSSYGCQAMNPLESGGNARVLKGDQLFDVSTLAREVSIARGVQDFDQGVFGHAISLPAANQLAPEARNHHNNIPFADVLDRCPYMASILESFETPKMSFRLLRRGPETAYALHDDKDKGANVVRLQIPIVTNDRAFLILPTDDLDLDIFGSFAGDGADANTEIPFDLSTLQRLCGSELRLFRLPRGHLYLFDTDRIHTMVNGGGEERITLSIDVFLNEWLRTWMKEHFTVEAEAFEYQGSEPIRWNWNALRHGVIRNEPVS